MTRRLVMMCIAGLGAALPAEAQHAKPAATDSARMQGTWVMLSGVTSGTPLPVESVREIRRVANGREVKVMWEREPFYRVTVTLNPAASPKEIDYLLLDGPFAGEIQRGIYSISGDTLRFCFSRPGDPRATDFTTVSDDGRILTVWVPRRR